MSFLELIHKVLDGVYDQDRKQIGTVNKAFISGDLTKTYPGDTIGIVYMYPSAMLKVHDAISASVAEASCLDKNATGYQFVDVYCLVSGFASGSWGLGIVGTPVPAGSFGTININQAGSWAVVAPAITLTANGMYCFKNIPITKFSKYVPVKTTDPGSLSVWIEFHN